MATIYIDNEPYQVKDGQNLLHACLNLGFDIPYFCWHPAMGSVGACRQCAVKQFKDENDTRGRIVMSCMTPVTEGMRISIDDDEVRSFRATVIEWMMTNHPHDCPVCDEGGECHLQDMTTMSGHNYRRYRFKKRTHINQYLGPFLNHEMNRCIQCYRCVRFYCDYAGGTDFGAFASHDNVYFGRHAEGVLENEFSGNLVEICPTGVFTDKTYREHYTRSWDLQTSPSVCVHCGLGCNITPGERYGNLRRVRNRYHGEVNGYFLCDRGRYGYEFVNSADRIKQALCKSGSGFRAPGCGGQPEARFLPAKKAELLAQLKAIPSGTMIGVGSPRASLESNFALRALVGPDRFYMGMGRREWQLVSAAIETMQSGPAAIATLRDMGEADAVLVLGEDVTNTAPRIALQLKQASRRAPMAKAEKLGIPEWNDAPVRELVQDARSPMFVATPCATRLDTIATESHYAAPDDLARLGYAVAHLLDSRAPSVADLADDVRALAERIANALSAAKKPLVISGPSCGNEALIKAAGCIAHALNKPERPAFLSLTASECNSVGARLMAARCLDDLLEAPQGDSAPEAMVVLENDLFRRADRERVATLLGRAKHLIALDHSWQDTSRQADVILPTAAFPEGDGTLVNNEGRAQRFIQTYVPGDDVQEGWRWLGEMQGKPWKTIDDVLEAMAAELPQLAAVREAAPASSTRFSGLRLPRQAHRFSGRTAMRAHLGVSEPKIPEDPDSPFTFSMEGYRGQVPGGVIPSYWSPGWNSVQGLNKFQEEIGGPLRGGDPGALLLQSRDGEAAFGSDGVPQPFDAREEERWIIPLFHIFGSEEWSMQSPPVAERAPAPYVAINSEDAATLRVADGEPIEVLLFNTVYRLPVAIKPSLPHGVAGLPVGLPGLPEWGVPAWGAIARGFE